MLKWLQQRFLSRPYEVSVIIPTYKNTRFLLECINSITESANGVCSLEILIGLDNCCDSLYFVSKNDVFKKHNIKIYYFPKNVGPYIIRNSLAVEAKYDNIFFFDSDDLMMKDTLKILLPRFVDKEILKFKFYNFENNKGKDLENLSLSTIMSHGVFLIKKSKFLELNGFFGWRCGADAEFTERYSAFGNIIYTLDIPLYYRRYHENNITRVAETSLHSKLREKYGRIILSNRASGEWKNPSTMPTLGSALIKL